MIHKNRLNSARGFTLIELLVVVAITGSTAMMVFTALDPAKRLTAVKTAQADVNRESFLKAANLRLLDSTEGFGSCPAGSFMIPTTPTLMSSSEYDVAQCLMPKYFQTKLPINPLFPGSHFSGPGDYNTGFTIAYSTETGKLDIKPAIPSAVLTFTYSNQFGSFGSDDGQFSSPKGISIAPSGNVYVADTGNNRIQIFDSTGNFLSKFGKLGTIIGRFQSPTDVLALGDSNVYVTDKNNYRVQVFNTANAYLSQFDTPSAPLSVSYGNGNLYIGVDGSGGVEPYLPVQVYDTSGNAQMEFGDADVPWSNYFHSVVPGADFNVYGTVNSSLNKVVAMPADGGGGIDHQFGSAGSGNGQFNIPRGLAFAPNGNMFVVDSGNNRVQIFNTSGTYLGQFGSAGSGNGQFNSPEDIAIDTGGKVYVVDAGNSRIQVFTP